NEEIDNLQDLRKYTELYEYENQMQYLKKFKDLKQVDIYINPQNFQNKTELLETLFCSFRKSEIYSNLYKRYFLEGSRYSQQEQDRRHYDLSWIKNQCIQEIDIVIMCSRRKMVCFKRFSSYFYFRSFSSKIASSTSGIIYPQLYKKHNDLMFPLVLGISLCIITFFTSWIIFYFDKNADKFAAENNSYEQKQNKKSQFKFSDIKKFDSELVSIPYQIAFGVPLFGLMTDKFGKICIGLGVTSCFALVSIFIILVAPQGENNPLICIAFAIFGIFLSSMCAYLYPTLPFLSQKQTLGTGFAICYSIKNGGLALMNFVCSYLMGSYINYKTPQLYIREVILKQDQQNIAPNIGASVVTYA
ncbi:hypothetical protein ABPG72_020875, partial [Tetrahymena utriculariae]